MWPDMCCPLTHTQGASKGHLDPQVQESMVKLPGIQILKVRIKQTGGLPGSVLEWFRSGRAHRHLSSQKARDRMVHHNPRVDSPCGQAADEVGGFDHLPLVGSLDDLSNSLPRKEGNGLKFPVPPGKRKKQKTTNKAIVPSFLQSTEMEASKAGGFWKQEDKRGCLGCEGEDGSCFLSLVQPCLGVTLSLDASALGTLGL